MGRRETTSQKHDKSGNRAPTGLHVSISGGLPRAVERGRERDCEALQIFCGNPRGWTLTERDEAELHEFRAACSEAGMSPVIVHACYLVNPCSADEEVRCRTVKRLRAELELSARLGADGYVLHPGSARDRPMERCIEQATDILGRALGEASATPPLLLENTATEHGPGGRLEWLARLADNLASGADAVTIGVCLDTCHLFAAGHDMRDAAQMSELAEAIGQTVGGDRVRLIHVNDARDTPGSRRDRHEHIGEGYIGPEGLRNFLLHPALRGTPAILETPWVSPEKDRRNLASVRRILAHEVAG